MAAAATTPLVELFGAQVTGKSGPVDTTSLSSVELVGIYFSAHWCPPCRAFTPRLIDCYNNVNKDGKRFEIIFASSDQDQSQYDEYYGEMPWLTLGFNAPLNESLSSKYRVQGIPTLVFIDPQTGKTITKDGRSAVAADIDGNEFPWTPKTFAELMSEAQIIGKDADNSTGAQLMEQLAGGHLGIYFSAHWCGPCRGFTPQLVQWYEENKSSLGGPFEIVFASSDRDEGAFNGYYAEMPWKALSFAQRGLKEKLSAAFQVRGIPTLAIVEVDTGKTVTTQGRMGIMSDPSGFPWGKKAFGKIGPVFIDGLQQTPTLMVFSEDDGSSQLPLVEPLGLAEMAKAKETGADEFDMLFLTVPKDDQLRDRLRALAQLGEEDTKLVIFDLSKGKFFPFTEDDAAKNAENITPDMVAQFAEAFKAGSVEGKELTAPGQ